MRQKSADIVVALALDMLKTEVSVDVHVQLGLAIVKDKRPDQHLYRHESTSEAMEEWVLFFLDTLEDVRVNCSPKQASCRVV
jgi:hypothetical protein